jgi:iron complex outermembrane receptor protein
MKSKRHTLLSCAIGSVLGVGGSAMAQDADTNRASILEEVVVTAEKREVSIQDVPVAVSAYTSETRTLLGVNTVEDLARFTPSLAYRNDDRLAIRGVGRLTNAVGTDPAVALYNDGIFSTSMADMSVPPLFIERTEVLRGPQGTLYGRNSVGGAINVISKRPTDDFEGEVRLTGGNYSYYRGEGLIRGPITDSVRYLVGGYVENRDEGFIKNVGPAEDGATSDRWMVEAQLEADLGENVVARVRYTKFEWHDTYGVGNTLNAEISPYDTTSPYNSGLYYNPTYGFTGENPAVTDPYVADSNRTVVGNLDDHNRINLDLTWDLGGATLKYFGGYQEYLYHTGSDNDGTSRTGTMDVLVPAGVAGVASSMQIASLDPDGTGPLAPFSFTRPTYMARNVTVDREQFYEESQRWWSNEINVSSNGEGALQWIFGLYQYDTTWDNPQNTTAHGDPGLLVPADGSTPNPNSWNGAIDGHLEGKSHAAFAQIDWAFADEWTLTLGARYTEDEKKGWDKAWYVGRSPATAIGAAEANFEAVFRATVLPAAGLPTNLPDAQLYALMQPGQPLAPFVQQVAAGILNSTQAISLDVTQTGTGCDGCVVNPDGGLTRNLEGEWDGVSGTAGFQWRPNDDTNLYLRYARGYKAGGFIASANMAPGVYAEPEYLNSYELGWKQTFGGRFQLNSAVFFYDYTDFQAPLSVQLPGGGGSLFATQFVNLDAEVKGVEVEAMWSPVDPLKLFVNASYVDSEITRGCCFQDTADPTAEADGAQSVGAGGAQTLVGNSMPNSPESKYTVGANYTWNFAPGALTLGGTYAYTDDLQSGVFSNPVYIAPSYGMTDFRLLWNDAKDRYTVIGFVKNATDEEAYLRATAGSPTAVGPRRSVGLVYPRTYGVELQFRFGN